MLEIVNHKLWFHNEFVSKSSYALWVRQNYATTGMCLFFNWTLAKELPNCLLYPPSMTIPEACINVEDVAALLLIRDAAFIAHLLQSSYFSNAAQSRLITNLKPEVRNRMYCFLHPEDYSSNVGDTNKEEEENDEEEEDNEEEQEEEEEEHSDDEIEENVESEEGDTS